MSSNFFDKIPSVSELLDSPPLKQLIDRANRNVVVTNVKAFVGRMATDLQNRAAEMKAPSVGELAERIADWIAKQRSTGPRAGINATGILLPDNTSLPLADEALHAASVTLRDYAVSAGQQNIADLLRQIVGAEAALVTATHSGAMTLALAATCGAQPAVIARGQVGEIEPGVPLPQLARGVGAALRECGTVERVQSEDYAELADGAGCILSIANTRYAIAGAEGTTDAEALARIAARQQIPYIADLGLGGLLDLAKYGLAGIPSAAEAISAGADLVILGGDRLLGGPACGIIVGREAAIERLRRHALWPAVSAAPAALIPLAATLQLYQDWETAERTIPILMLLAASSENLRSRADRLAPQVAASSLVAGTDILSGTATLLGRHLAGQELPTTQVVVRPREIAATELAERLRVGEVPVTVRISGDVLIIDLRTVFPRQDMHLVEAFASLSASSQSAHE